MYILLRHLALLFAVIRPLWGQQRTPLVIECMREEIHRPYWKAIST